MPAMATLHPIEEYPQVQQEQVGVLESIYGENFHRVPGHKSAWQPRNNLAFEIRVDAYNDKEISVILHVDLPPDWPKISPSIKLKEVDGVRPHVRDRIRALLKSSKANTDIFTICTDLQDVMEDAAESKVRRQVIPALDEERAEKAAELRRKVEEEEERLAKEQRERQAQANLVITKQIEGLQIKQQQRVTGLTSSEEDGPPRQLNLPNPIVQFDRSMTITDKHDNTTKFRDVWGTYVILQTKEKKVTVVTPIVENYVTARRLLLKEIHLEADIFSRPAQLLGEIREVEQLLQVLKENRHESVVDLLGYKVRVNQRPDDEQSIESVDLTILSAYANKGSLAELLDVYDSLNGTKIISWTTQLLDALAFLDQLGFAHPAVHLNNILVFHSSDGRISVKLADGYGLDLRTLVMEARSASGIKEPKIPAGWRAPELNEANPVRTEKTCMWDLGVVVIQMVSGKDVIKEYSSPKHYMSTHNLTDELYEMLSAMCAHDQAKRGNAYDLTTSEFLRGDGTLFINSTPSGPSGGNNADRRGSAIVQKDSSWKSQWQIIKPLGKGGFGEVFKALHRLDMKMYAVKRVRCDTDDDFNELIREIKLLSGLESPRIVRYSFSWIESDAQPVQNSEDSTENASQSIPQLRSTGNRWVDDGADFLSAPEVGIQFGNSPEQSPGPRGGFFYRPGESSSDSDGEAETSDTPEQRHDAPPRVPKPTGPRSIFIAMQLCEDRSLRNLIRNCALTDMAEIWRMFGQIVEGLEYIHSRGVIHRDLKPENIFLAELNEIRIGDFGLATRGKLARVGGETIMNQATEESRSIGTAIYVAPELRSNGAGAYSSKVDMYSLGITFLEMCCPVTTQTSRIKMLSNARRSIPILPAELNSDNLKSQKQLIIGLLDHDQEQRPSATDILTSGVIPRPVGREEVHQYVMNIIKGEPKDYGELVEHFFRENADIAQDRAWDQGLNAIEQTHEAPFSSTVNQKIQKVFLRHGGVEGNRQDIFPVSSLYLKPAIYLDRSGMTLQLRYDMTYPFARFLAHSKVDYPRNYTFGVVYREGNPGGRPSPRSEISFDIVSHSTKDLTVKEAEIIKVLDEILAEFPSLRKSKSIVVFINHSDLLDMILKSCGVRLRDLRSVKNILSALNYGANTWKRIETELRGAKYNLTQATMKQLAFFNFSETLSVARKKIENLLQDPADISKLHRIFHRLSEIQKHAHSFKVEIKIMMHPLASHSATLYEGNIMFQCVDAVQKKILAVGGRYDQIIHAFGTESITTAPRAVGLRLNSAELADRLAMDLATPKATKVGVRPQRCDVLLTSIDENTLTTSCLELAAELWSNDISAEISDHYDSREQFAATYKQDAANIILHIRQDGSAVAGVGIRARILGKQDEEDIKRTELVTWLKTELKDKQPGEDPRGKLRRETSAGDTHLLTVPEHRTAEFIYITPKHRGKKTNRQNLVDDAALVVKETARSYIAEAPTVVVEATSEVMDNLRGVRMDSHESWKAFFQACPAEETRYLKDVQEQLQTLTDGGKKGAWIFSSKTRGCFYCNL